MTLGTCYYPEHWPRERWREDAATMRELGITRVRIGEFAWSKIEPDPGRFDWAWLDEAMDVLHEAGLGIILGTPTATPPKWLIDQNPSILPVGRDGRVRGFGSRRHYCFRSPAYLRETERIVTALAERYGSHPGLVAWQTDNEYGCHDTTRCWCDTCRSEFRTWLKDRYETVDALNDAWWTTFWSQTYRTFGEVELPEQAVTETNPSHQLDYRRFASDGVVAYNALQVRILKAHSDAPVVHNSMMLFGDYDHVDLADDLDAIAFDNYPIGQLEESPFSLDVKEQFLRTGHPDLVTLSHDLYRGLKDQPHWIMEQQPGQVNWAPNNALPAAGAVRLWTLQGFAHGAEMVSWFRYRAAVGAQETNHAGLLRHDGTPDVAYHEAKRVAGELAAPEHRDVHTAIRSTGDATDRPRVALLVDFEDLWATDIQPHASAFNYWGQLFGFYAPLRGLDVTVDLVPKKHAGREDEPHARSLEPYDLVIAPAMQLVDEDVAQRLDRYVKAGGRLLLGPRSGARTVTGRAQEAAPGPLRDLVGARVTRVDGLRPDVQRSITMLNGNESLTYRVWADLLEVEGDGVALAHYDDPAYQGATAYVKRSHGSGEARMLGASLEPEAMTTLLEAWLGELGIPTRRLPDGLRRSGAWWLNFTSEAHTIDGVTIPALEAVPVS